MNPGWPEPVQLKLGTVDLRIRVRSLEGRPQVVLELTVSRRGGFEVTPVLAIPARQCRTLGDALLKFAAGIPDRAHELGMAL